MLYDRKAIICSGERIACKVTASAQQQMIQFQLFYAICFSQQLNETLI